MWHMTFIYAPPVSVPSAQSRKNAAITQKGFNSLETIFGGPATVQPCFLQIGTLCSSVAELRFSICKVAAGMSCGFFQKHTPTKQKFYPEKTHLYNALIIS